MIKTQCTKCKKVRWAHKTDANHICKPCVKKAGIAPPRRTPKFKRTGPRRKAALPQPEKKKKRGEKR